MLSLKQEKFCEYYVQSGNATEAAIKAGYSEKSARSQGAENLTKPDILKKIEALKNVSRQENIASANKVLEFFTEVMNDKNAPLKERLKAAENLAKRLGVDKPEEAKTSEDNSQPIFEFVFKDMSIDENEN